MTRYPVSLLRGGSLELSGSSIREQTKSHMPAARHYGLDSAPGGQFRKRLRSVGLSNRLTRVGCRMRLGGSG